MRAHRAWRWSMGCLVGFGLAQIVPLHAEELPAPIKERIVNRGHKLFQYEWQPDDKLSVAGDGLGPLYNATSCAACHHQGGTGGGGPNDNNVDLLIAVPPNSRSGSKSNRALDQFQNNLTLVHAAFRNTGSGVVTNLILHRHGPNDAYDEFRAKLLGRSTPTARNPKQTRQSSLYARSNGRPDRPAPVETLPTQNKVNLQLSHRNTPALFGAGLIDAIPETSLNRIAEQQPARARAVSGRLVGRFGWRGQTRTLAQFVENACANELGLELKDRRQPTNPLDANYKPPGADMDATQVGDLVAFVASLAAPAQHLPLSAADRVTVTNGEQLFGTVGCAVCHVRDIEPAKGIYSDLLLHDMGAGLADPVAAPVSIREVSSENYYSGGPSVQDLQLAKSFNVDQEWRTPPLWGVHDSAPYLHDGRAATLEEAILAHDGEAKNSRERFEQLGQAERGRIIAFLETLVAP